MKKKNEKKKSIDLKYFPEITEQRHYNLRWILFDSWCVEGRQHAFTCCVHWDIQIKWQQHVDSRTESARHINWNTGDNSLEFTIHAGENVKEVIY